MSRVTKTIIRLSTSMSKTTKGGNEIMLPSDGETRGKSPTLIFLFEALGATS